MLTLKVDSGGYGQERGNIPRPLPLVAHKKWIPLKPLMTDHQRVDQHVIGAAYIQKRRAFGRTQPLMEIAGVEVRIEGFYVDLQLARNVRPVDERDNASLPRTAANFFHREGQRSWRGDVAQEDDARLRRNRA